MPLGREEKGSVPSLRGASDTPVTDVRKQGRVACIRVYAQWC